MHPDILSFPLLGFSADTDGVKSLVTSDGVLFILAQMFVIGRINDCEHVPRQRYPAESIAVPEPPV
jgi:hypothetical protein